MLTPTFMAFPFDFERSCKAAKILLGEVDRNSYCLALFRNVILILVFHDVE